MNQKLPALSAACLLALAGTGSASEPPRHDFECDTPAGHFSYWNRTVSGPGIDVTGAVTVNELRTDKKWIPVALVSLRGGADERENFGLRLYTLPKVPDNYFLEIVKPSGNEKLGLGLVPSTKDAIPFELHLDGSGQIRVSLAGLEATTPVGDFKASSLQMSCSTGDFEFKDVVVKDAG